MPLSAFRPRSAPGTLPPAAQYTKKLSSRARDHAANDEGRVVKVLIMPAFKSGTTASADMGRANKNPCMSGQSQFRSKLNCSGVSTSSAITSLPNSRERPRISFTMDAACALFESSETNSRAILIGRLKTVANN